MKITKKIFCSNEVNNGSKKVLISFENNKY